MFEKWFGGKKDKYDDNVAIPGQEKMAKIETAHVDEDGVLISGEDGYTGDRSDLIQHDSEVPVMDALRKEREARLSYGKNEKRTKGVKPAKKDLHSDWKEKGAFDTPLSKEEVSEEILNTMEQEEDTKAIREMYDYGDEEYKDAA